MFDLLEKYIHDDAWLELRVHDRQTRSFFAEDGLLDGAKLRRHGGIGVRALVDGAFGFASTSDLTPAGIEAAIRRAKDCARAAAKQRKTRIELPPAAAWKNGSFVTDAHDPVSARGVDEKVDMVLRAQAAVSAASERISSSSARYVELVDEKWIMTSDGARVHLRDVKPEFRVGAVAKDGTLMQTAVEAEGKTGGFGDLFRRRSMDDMVQKAAKTAVDLLHAPSIEGGHNTVILAPDVVGLLVHEAIGHTVEADFVLSGSAAAGKIGHKVASDLVTLCDSGHSEYEPGAGGIVQIDDEGVPTERTVIIEDGVLKSYLHNRESAAHFGVAPTGNARAFEYDDEPLIRMRNTYIEPGQTPLEQMIADTPDGFLLASAKNGQADANAEFMFAVGEIYPIKNGKLGPLHKGGTITGDAFDVLKSVDMLGDAFRWDLGSGYCGKGQPAKVDAGGPHVRCQVSLSSQGG